MGGAFELLKYGVVTDREKNHGVHERHYERQADIKLQTVPHQGHV